MALAMKILIIGPAWVGDMVMAQALFKLLKQLHPHSQIDVLAPLWTRPLLVRMPEVNEALDSPFDHGQLRLLARYRLGVALRSRGYDQAIVLPNSFKSALIPYFANIPLRTGWVGESRYGLLNDARRLDKKRLPRMVERFIGLGVEKGEALPSTLLYPKLNVSVEGIRASLEKLQLDRPSAPLLILCPGAEFGVSKQWPAEYHAEVANNKLAEGWQIWLLGSVNDRGISDQVDALTDHRCMNLTGKTGLTEVIDLLSLADVVVANDSGLMHVAASLSRPLVVIYGSTSPEFAPPLFDRVEILSLELPCSPCSKRECPLKHNKCMRDLKPIQVINSINSFSI